MAEKNNDLKIAEYNAIRNEILQLNSQIYNTFYGTILFVVTVFGWYYKNNLESSIMLYLFLFLILLIGNIVVINRNRLAHRLALVIRYFIEEKNTDLQWSTVYFEYRKLKKERFDFIYERLADIILSIFLLITFILLVFLYFNIRCICSNLIAFIIGIISLLFQILSWRYFNKYQSIETKINEVKKKLQKKDYEYNC